METTDSGHPDRFDIGYPEEPRVRAGEQDDLMASDKRSRGGARTEALDDRPEDAARGG
jgi:hypothetical protein